MKKRVLRFSSVGTTGFVDRHHVLTEEQRESADRVRERLRAESIDTVRVVLVDQHGVPRSKFLSSSAFESSLASGLDFPGAVFIMDTGHHMFTPLFSEGGGVGLPELTGFGDVVVVPDPTTFRTLPWEPTTGWVLCDMYFANGQPVPLDARTTLRRQLDRARDAGWEYLSGLEVEFYIVKLETSRIPMEQSGHPPPPPPVSLLARGYQSLSETRTAQIGAVLSDLRRSLDGLGLPVRSMEDEYAPGQYEVTFDPLPGIEGADAMVLFRSVTKQICHQHGCLATFMCRPAFPEAFSSGWHLHESLLHTANGMNAFVSDNQTLSPLGRSYVAGLLEHAQAMTVFATPTINGYKRFRPYSFAPERVNWAIENRGAMVRVQGAPGDPGTHIENRLGEPAANPYFYMAADLAAGLDGIERSLTPPPPVDVDPYADAAPRLPRSLWEAVDQLECDAFFRKAFSPELVDYMVMLKRAEVDRFLGEVTDWEQREYFEFF